MDSLIAAAGRALSTGDVLGALKHVGWRDDPPALALRGIAMAQLGDYPRARDLLRRAARGFGPREPMARARCVVAEAEVALALRDFGAEPQRLHAAAQALATRGDRANARHAELIALRRQLLLGRLQAARAAVDALDLEGAPAAHHALAALAQSEIALRSLRTREARLALQRAKTAAAQAGIPALSAEIAQLDASLQRPAARVLQAGHEQLATLDDVEALLASGALVVDAVRHALREGGTVLSFARRPVLFALLRALATGWPGDVDRNALIAHVFRTRQPDETHRARLRVEIGRLRRLLRPFAALTATARGFQLSPHGTHGVVVLAPPVDGEQGALHGLLADGMAWSTSALALATGDSQRSVQRALAAMEATGHVRAVGRARAQRWVAPPLAGFTTILLLPAATPPA
ncbi:helix-turn-helix domain-containing protein [Pseudoxanthomonas sp. LH2527]|uniref:helix-turn-helix domain-containing protein n=1 Tax=Pseudoxanthomonas sp. LH2527 TaxID=2923249 RepID=UPI001F135DD2|nr:helix-turn-helix domain-containing protein [Pseudoxanthomonas sp. LH2527]MCH6485481.1 helix-turn-helix domain-containing protein [Pseudoxanthomonas sp. LH2527]